jgi:hypothetical protein
MANSEEWVFRKQKHLSDWLNNFRKANDIVLEVQMNLDITNWEIEAIKNRPTISGELPSLESSDILERDYKYTTLAFPSIPDFNPIVAGTASTITASGAAYVYNYVSKIGDIADPGAVDFSNKYTGLYHQIQTEQDRPSQVRQLMQKFCGLKTLQRFDSSEKSYFGTRSGAITPKVSALDIRNTLDGVQGDLFNRARANPKENMTWQEMVKRLSKGNLGDEYNELLRQESVRSNLIANLSEILKDRNRGSATNLNHLWPETLDHIYTVLGLLKLPK